MNPVQIANRIDFYNDDTRSPRRYRIEYDNAVKEAIRSFMDEILKPGFIQKDQFTSDELNTLLKVQSAAPTTDVALTPADYLYFVSLTATIGGVIHTCRPTNFNELEFLKGDSYRFPSDIKPYYIQSTTGWTVYHGSGTITSCSLVYVKNPASFTIGKDSQLIDAGGTLTNGLQYYATMPAVYAGVFFNIGDSFTGTGAALTSGQVILTTNTTALDLPDRTHEQICRMASELMTGVAQSYNQSAFSEKEANKA